MDILSCLLSDSDEWSDPRTRGWFLIQKPIYILMIISIYVLFSTKIGPALMRNRKAFNLNRTVQMYNLLQVIGCAIFFVQFLRILINAKYNFICESTKISNDYWKLKVIEYQWLYFMFKLIDFADTVFFVLRKKYNQITFLHVFHHGMTFFITWCFTKYAPGGMPMLSMLLNTFVHIVMYTYYFIASAGPQYKKYLWLKRYVTETQLVQFLILSIHSCLPLIWDCGYPKGLAAVITTYMIILFCLFLKFYIKSYTKRNAFHELKAS